MSYRLYTNKRNPISLWMLDSGSMVDASGRGVNGSISGTVATSTSLVAGALASTVFHTNSVGQFLTPIFKPGLERRTFALEAWVYPIAAGNIQVLSHSGVFDGLWMNGTVINFTTKYSTAADATASYDIQTHRAIHIVGVHTLDQNQLWVDGQMVASIQLTIAQKADTFLSSDGYLYAGGAADTTPRISANGFAVYNTLDPKDIAANFKNGRNVMPQTDVPYQLNGLAYSLDSSGSNFFFNRTWDTGADFAEGNTANVSLSADTVQPKFDSNGLSIASSWSDFFFMDATGLTSIYGVGLEWFGLNITVDASTDNGTTWTAVSNARLATNVPNGFVPTGKKFLFRVNFPAGLTQGQTFLDSIKVIGYANSNFYHTDNRAITITYPGVFRNDFEPIEYRNHNGVNVGGGTLTFGPDTSSDPTITRTFEFWVKNVDNTFAISGVNGIRYRNGVANSSNLPVGEWSLVHYVESANVTGNITISGNCIIGQIATYPTALTADQVSHIYKSYTGFPVLSFVDSGGVSVTENADAALVYYHDWAIESGRG